MPLIRLDMCVRKRKPTSCAAAAPSYHFFINNSGRAEQYGKVALDAEQTMDFLRCYRVLGTEELLVRFGKAAIRMEDLERS